jgi:hypothetical protein
MTERPTPYSTLVRGRIKRVRHRRETRPHDAALKRAANVSRIAFSCLLVTRSMPVQLKRLWTFRSFLQHSFYTSHRNA